MIKKLSPCPHLLTYAHISQNFFGKIVFDGKSAIESQIAVVEQLKSYSRLKDFSNLYFSAFGTKNESELAAAAAKVKVEAGAAAEENAKNYVAYEAYAKAIKLIPVRSAIILEIPKMCVCTITK